MYNLLSHRQVKMDKSLKYGFMSVVLHLRNAFRDKKSGENTCPWATAGCIKGCLVGAGRMHMQSSVNARAHRTAMFFEDRSLFLALLSADLFKALRKARKLKLKLTCRLNGTSDLAWEQLKIGSFRNIMAMFPEIQFIDYTKSIKRAFDSVRDPSWPKNYKLVYSYNEKSDDALVSELLKLGGNVAVVFNVKKGKPLPQVYEINGMFFFVCDGDHNDLRHLDPKGYIVGLRYKLAVNRKRHKAIDPNTLNGFVVNIGETPASLN